MNIFLFHRDFRIEDNTGLINFLNDNRKNLYLFFIFNEQQLEVKNFYFNKNSFSFLIKSLVNLDKKININFFLGSNEIEIFESIKEKVKTIYTNKDLSQFAILRSEKLKIWAKTNNVIYKEFYDYTFFKPKKILNKSGLKYEKFTSFYLSCLANINFKNTKFLIPDLKKFIFLKLKHPKIINIKKIFQSFLNFKFSFKFPQNRRQVFLQIKKNKEENLLSPAIKFGIISVREAIYFSYKITLNLKNNFIRQIFWREFFYHYAYISLREESWQMGQNINKIFENFPFEKNITELEKWKQGKTGIKIIDAGINELVKTGWMKNRIRMICASYLTKTLRIHWKEGEKFFAKHLLDYDPIVNQFSWQWCAGTGLDKVNYVRFFNPFLQEKKYDKKSIYTKKWLKNYNLTNLKTEEEIKKMNNKSKEIFYQWKKSWKIKS